MRIGDYKDPKCREVRPALFKFGNETYLDLSKLYHSKFPGGEINPLYALNEIENQIPSVYAPIESSDDLMSLMILKDCINSPIDNLFIPYMPYGRQDRPTSKGHYKSAFTLKTFAKIINTIPIRRKIITIDAHSTVCHGVFNKDLENFLPVGSASTEIGTSRSIIVVIPDFGARSRAQAFMKYLDTTYQYAGYIQFNKSRSEVNSVESIKVADREFNIPPGATQVTLLVVDDIFDGGATMLTLAPELEDFCGKELFQYDIEKKIYTSHGIYSNLDNVRELIKRGYKLYCTNSHSGSMAALDSLFLDHPTGLQIIKVV